MALTSIPAEVCTDLCLESETECWTREDDGRWSDTNSVRTTTVETCLSAKASTQ